MSLEKDIESIKRIFPDALVYPTDFGYEIVFPGGNVIACDEEGNEYLLDGDGFEEDLTEKE